MANPGLSEPKLKVAIIGGGPAGLAAAIELSRRSFIDWRLYEKKPEISELGTGLSLQRNTWRMLERMGAAHHLKRSEFFRPLDGHDTQHRNGRTGKLVSTSSPPNDIAPHQRPCRIHRAKLQQTLLKQADRNRVFVGKRLVDITRREDGKLRISFEDGLTDEVDLLVGADGIRSIVREFAFPSHQIGYTGTVAYRAIVKTSDALDINGMPEAVIFWHGVDGKWVYTCPLGGGDFEITAKIHEPGGDDRSSWGKTSSLQHFLNTFSEFCSPVQQALDLVTEVQQFDFFAGPRLNTIINHGSVALIGDASHPLSGAFGAGAGFALEDAHVLGGAIEWAASSGRSVTDALVLFDSVRTPHYNALYDVLDGFADVEGRIARTTLPVDEEIAARIEGIWASKHNWMYYHEADTALASAIEEIEQVGSQGSLRAQL